jgi:hypothetical protein
MRFREKDTDCVISELVSLMSRYKVLKMCAADWIISRRRRREIFTRLKELDLDIECFYETRADLTKEEILLMQQAGVTTIQPGIESFSTELLMLMNKNTSRIRHVQFLRWCKEYGIYLSYNILGGFPGEHVEWYRDMAAFLPHIVHLQPPVQNLHFVEMHRFSPLFQAKEQFGVDRYELREDYAFNFPPGLVDPLKSATSSRTARARASTAGNMRRGCGRSSGSGSTPTSSTFLPSTSTRSVRGSCRSPTPATARAATSASVTSTTTSSCSATRRGR